MKVLHCFAQYLDNQQNWTYLILKNTLDIDVIIASKRFLKNNFYKKEFEYIEFPVKYVETNEIKQSIVLRTINFIIHILLKLLFPKYVTMMLKNRDIDIVHSHFAPVGWHYRKVAKKLKAPHVVSFYGYDYEKLPFKEPKWIKKYQELFKQADLFICEGTFGARTLVKIGCPKDKIKIVRLGVEIKDIQYYSRVKFKNELKLLQIAHLTEKKGHIYTVKAFIKALKSYPNMSLTLVGSGDEIILNRIKNEISICGVEDRITINNSIDFNQIYEFMKDYHVFIHPSCHTADMDCEGGAPVVLLNAQATGMPVISTVHCDIPEEVINGETGLLTQEKDIDSLSESIKVFYNMDNNEYQTYCHNARVHIEENYDSIKNLKILKDIYTNLSNIKFQP